MSDHYQPGATTWRRIYPILAIGLIFLGIILVEWVFVYQNATYAIVLALVLVLVIYSTLPLMRLRRALADSVESLVLVPLYILITASLPWFFLSQVFLIPAVYSIILGICFWHIYRKNIGFRELGFTRLHWRKYVVIGILIGIPLGSIEYFILKPIPLSLTFEFKNLLRDLIYMLFFVGLGEELLFRGLIQRDLTRAFGWRWGLFAASLLFGIMHMTWRSVPELFFTFGAGLIFGYVYYRTKSLTAPVIIHAVGNVVLIGILPFLWG